MTEPKKPATRKKGLAGAAASVVQAVKAMVPPPEPEAAQAPDESHLSTVDRVRLHINEILVGIAEGKTLTEIGEAMNPPIGPFSLRSALYSDEEAHRRYKVVLEHKAHGLIELAAEQADKLAKASMAKEAADVALKVAAKLAPHLYGDKQTVALTGADGGPVKSTVTMTPADAYKAMLGGQA